MSKLKDWWIAATTDEKKALAKGAGTTFGNLRQSAGRYRPYSMKAGLARRIEITSEELRKRNKALPVLSRTDLCADCANCEFAKRHLGNKK